MNITGIEMKLQELSDTINECVHAQKEQNQRFRNYLMHLENHRHQFAVYMKKKNKDFLDSLMQSFNFHASARDGPAAEAAVESEEELESEEDPSLAEEEKDEKEKEQEETEEEQSRKEESAAEKDEPPPIVPPKCSKKHIIKADEQETEDDEPPIALFSRKGRENVLTDEESYGNQDDIDA